MAHSDSVTWLWGCSLNLGTANNTLAELWGIRKALLHAWDKGHRNITLQTDSLLATKWLTTSVEFPIELSNLILDCRRLLRRDWEALVESVWREANSCADMLANKGTSQTEREILYDTCPYLFLEMTLLELYGFCLIP